MMTTKTVTRFEITDAVVKAMEGDRNPAVRQAAVSLAPMIERHTHNEFDRAKDLQSINDANFSLPLDYRYALVYHE